MRKNKAVICVVVCVLLSVILSVILSVTNSLSCFSVSQCLSQERNSATVCLLPLLCCCRYCCHSDSQPSRLRLQWTFPQKTASLPASDRGKGVSLRDKCIYMFSTPLPHMEVRGSQSYLFALILVCFLFANGQSSKLQTGSEQHEHSCISNTCPGCTLHLAWYRAL